MNTCPNCGGKEFTETSDAWICQYCDTRHPKPAPKAVPSAAPVWQTEPVYREATDLGQLRQKNKWVSFALCLFLGCFGAHKFYEGKIGMGILYLFTCGLFYIGWIVDCFVLLCKPNPYYL